MKRVHFSPSRAILLVLLLSTLVFGQDRGTITGLVLDSNGAAVPGAAVTATNMATNGSSTAVTSNDGIYTIPALPPGTYKIRVEKTGFKSSEVPGVVLTVGNTTSANVTMTVGQVSEVVEIAAAGGAQVQTENAKISSQVSNKQIDQLPLVVSGTMRSPFDLSLLTPESKPIGLGGDAGTGGPGYSSNFSLGGGQGGTWGITLDGASSGTSRFGSTEWSSLNTPSIDAITEFSVDTNGFKADSGRAQGGSLAFSSKSGTNEYHGTVYEFARNNAFDARNYFENKTSVLKQHDYGLTLGGPVRIPWVYNGKNKTFFFGSAEWFRNRAGSNSFVTSVPTPEMYQGDFSRWVDPTGKLLTIYDPATTRANPAYDPTRQISETNPRFIRDPFPGNKIPTNRISPLTQKYLSYVGNSVFPNSAGAPGTYSYVNQNFRSTAGSSLFPWTKWSVKLDHNFSEKHKISGLYNYGLSEVLPGVDGFPRLPGTVSDFRYTQQDSHVYRVNYTWTISPTLVNYLYGGVNWWKQFNYTPNIGGGWKNRGICLPGAFDCDNNLLQVEFQSDGYYTWGGSAGDGSENPIFTIGDDLTVIKGRHTIKGGYLYERLHYNGFGRQTLSGLVRVSRAQTSIPQSGNSALGGGNSFASFLLGEVNSAQTENDRFVRQYWIGHAAYIQDDWKVSQKLTLNFGLRYDVTLPPLERDDKWSDFDPFVPNPSANNRLGALRFAGFNQGEVGKRTLVEGWYNGWGPRFSFAYSPDQKTVVRGGVGRTFGLVRTTSGSTHFAGAIQIYSVPSPDGINRLFKLDDGFIVNGVNTVPQPPSVNPGFNTNADVDWWQGQEVSRLPENWNWTLSLQRELPGKFLLEASYNASVGVHLMSGLLNVNQLDSKYIYDPRIQPLLNLRIDSPEVRAAGFSKPYASFPDNLSLNRALRPFPQYANINTWSGNGDRSGHSTYHAAVVKMERRVSTGVYLQGSYVFSKLITDTDTVDAGGRAMDFYNRRLEKSVGAFDLPHNVKFSYILESPIGKGKKWDLGAVGNAVVGGWRFSAIHVYTSGQPIQLSGGAVGLGGRSAALVKTLDGWVVDAPSNPNYRATTGFTSYFAPVCSIAAFCNAAGAVVPQVNTLGNAPRFNTLARRPANLNENVSLHKSFNFTERFRLDFRWEVFNVFNRVILGPPDSSITSQNFGRITSAGSPRQMQFGLKLYF
ncbi:MAG: carboxypeptidase regulatory-like domain-containing protein [Blastocatellia bacterium]|nr:carboxypeptidase regulatory-like domain-containing protein [Blastocatellia bacterium]